MTQIATRSFHRTLILALVGLAIALVLEGQVFDTTRSYNTCRVDRFSADVKTSWAAVRGFHGLVFKSAIVCLISFLIVLVFWSNDSKPTSGYAIKGQVDWNSIFGCGYTTVFYGVTYCFIDALKDIIADATCNNKNNSISGHFSFFTFYSLTLAHLALSLLPLQAITPPPLRKSSTPKSQPAPTTLSTTTTPTTTPTPKLISLNDLKSPKSALALKLVVMLALYLGFLVCAAMTLYGTYVWGYHSLRQIYLGCLSGLLSHLLLTTIFSQASSNNNSITPSSNKNTASTKTNLWSQVQKAMASTQNLKSQETINLLRGPLYPLSFLASYSIVAALVCLIITHALPFATHEYYLFLLVTPVVIYSFLFPLNGRFTYRRSPITSVGIKRD